MNKIDKLQIDQETEEHSLTGDSNKHFGRAPFTETPPPCSQAPQGATGQIPCSPGTGETPTSPVEHLLSGTDNSRNLEVLTEKVGPLDLRSETKNRSGATKMRARRVWLAEAPTGDYRRLAPAPRLSH